MTAIMRHREQEPNHQRHPLLRKTLGWLGVGVAVLGMDMLLRDYARVESEPKISEQHAGPLTAAGLGAMAIGGALAAAFLPEKQNEVDN